MISRFFFSFLLLLISLVHGTNRLIMLIFVFVSSRMHITNESIAKGTNAHTQVKSTL